jgi:hypothetical protein
MPSRNSAAQEPSARALAAELAERQERDLAATDDAALVAYEAKWQRKLRRLQQAFPERWRVAGLSDDEVRDILTLRLIEAVRSPAPGALELERVGKEWGLLVARRELGALRKSFKLGAIPSDFSEAPLVMHSPNQEEQWLEGEAERGRAVAQERAERDLSRPQRRWLAALKLSARGGGFFQASAEPNLSAASRVLGKNRSSAQRAYRELQARFAHELARVKK